jgi:membrane protein
MPVVLSFFGSNSRMQLRQIRAIATASVAAWVDDRAPSMGAALAYYTLFSIAPLLLIVISIAGLVFGRDAARGQIFAELNGLMGPQGASAVQALLQNVGRPSDGILGTIVGTSVLLIGAMSVFGELQNSLDRIWRAPPRIGGAGLRVIARARLLSFGMILGIGFLLMVSLVVSAAVTALGTWWTPLLGGLAVLLEAINFVISFAFITLTFAMIYKLMPRVRIAWRDVWMGAAVTAFLFTVGKFLIGFYIGTSGIASGYGAAGSLIVVLVWVYYSAQVFLLGAEFTRVYAQQLGSHQGDASRAEWRSPRPGFVDSPASVVASRAAIAAALQGAGSGTRTVRPSRSS